MAEVEEKPKVPVPNVETNFGFIPMDIVRDILLRLPAASLLTSKAVCKSWRSLVSDPQFVKCHVNLANNGRHNIVNYIELNEKRGCFPTFDHRSRPSIYRLSIINSKDSEIQHNIIHYPFEDRRNNVVLGSCNGLLLVDTEIETFLWNPTTRKYRKTLPEKKIWEEYPSPCSYYVSGLGYHSLLDEYKAVIYFVSAGRPHMFILSCRSGYWKEVDHGDHDLPDSIYYDCFTLQGLTVNGSPHWMGPDPNACHRTIIYFDMVEERFKMLPTPTMSWWKDDYLYEKYVDNMVILGGCLCVAYKNFGDGLHEFWQMKEYGVTESWSKLFVIRDSSTCFVRNPLGITKNGDEVVLLVKMTEFVTYNLKTNEEKNVLSTIEKRCTFSINVAATYVESLVSPWSN